tara:strand:+ start:8968 stop:10557 length:1590 start_codon:yes stop_codon:yes gene_type:complete
MLNFLLRLFFIVTVSFLWNSCDNEINFDVNDTELTFSKDTIYLDTVFTNIGSSTYNLKVYNNSNRNILIPEIKLSKGEDSYYRLNVDGIYDQNNDLGKRFNNIEILANDSLYIFIETTIDINELNTDQNSFLYEDKIEFLNSNSTQDVKLISLVKDAVFIYPERYEGDQQFIYETLEIDFNGDGVNEQTNIRGRYLDEDELIFTNDKPYVIYGYAAAGLGNELIIEKGARIHFHDNSGLIISNGASIKANGEFSQNPTELENQIIFEGDRLEPYFENVPGQWGTIWLLEGSLNNEFSYCTIKNASVGIYTNGGDNLDDYMINLNNVQIYNSSNFGILSISSSVSAQNLVINKSGQSSFAGIYGGKFHFNHCTIANFWSSGIRQYPSALFNNFYIDSDENEFINEVFELIITNSVIDGNQNIEFLIEKLGSYELNYSLYDTMVRFNDINNYFSDDPTYDFSDNSHYINLYNNLNSNFVNPFFNDLRINQFSELIGLGNLQYSINSPFDILNNSRADSSDLGAFQHTIIED